MNFDLNKKKKVLKPHPSSPRTLVIDIMVCISYGTLFIITLIQNNHTIIVSQIERATVEYGAATW